MAADVAAEPEPSSLWQSRILLCLRVTEDFA
jgi:hypothetical protein